MFKHLDLIWTADNIAFVHFFNFAGLRGYWYYCNSTMVAWMQPRKIPILVSTFLMLKFCQHSRRHKMMLLILAVEKNTVADPYMENNINSTLYSAKRQIRRIYLETILVHTIREGSRYQIGCIFWKNPSGLWPPPLIFGKWCCKFFIMDMVAYMQGGMRAR